MSANSAVDVVRYLPVQATDCRHERLALREPRLLRVVLGTLSRYVGEWRDRGGSDVYMLCRALAMYAATPAPVHGGVELSNGLRLVDAPCPSTLSAMRR